MATPTRRRGDAHNMTQNGADILRLWVGGGKLFMHLPAHLGDYDVKVATDTDEDSVAAFVANAHSSVFKLKTVQKKESQAVGWG